MPTTNKKRTLRANTAAGAKSKKKKPATRGKKKTGGRSRLLARVISVATLALFLGLCVLGDWYVHHPREWLQENKGLLTAPLEYLGDRTALLTDGLGWTGHDAVYESDDPVPEGQVFFAGAPVRTGAPAPADIVTLNRGEFVLGWSPSLQHPVWAAYHVVPEARFSMDLNNRPNFQKDRNVANSPSADAYTRSGYDRGHMVPNRAIVTRYGPDEQKKTFLMTNIAPQKPALNRGPWRELEQRIVELWTAKYGEIWVVVGTVPSPSREKLPNSSVSIPSHYYMLMLAQTPDGVRALAVLLSQDDGIGCFPVHSIVTINELEEMTGLDFLPDMPGFLKKPLKADRPTRLWPVRLLDILKLVLIRFC